MKYCIVGVGKLGSAIANAMMLRQMNNAIVLYEPMLGAMGKARAQFLDLLPVAKVTGNKLLWAENKPRADVYVITAGVPRSSPDQTKRELYNMNFKIVHQVLEDLKVAPTKTVFIATNPPIEITESIRGLGYNAWSCRDCTDQLRKDSGLTKQDNDFVIEHKGYTEFTPGLAIADFILWRRRNV